MPRARTRAASLVFVVATAALATIVSLAGSARGGDTTPAVEVVKVPTARGVTLEASLHKPAKPNGIAIAMAPGQGGGRERPVVKKTSEALAAAGFTVVRFDWAYFTAKKEPSEDLSTEVADLDAAVDFAKKLPGVTKVIVAGKSLGTVAAVKRLERKQEDPAALLLLTLPLAMGDEAATPREGMDSLLRTQIPTLVVVGDHDPLCPLAMLYAFAAKSATPFRVVVVPGDHSLAKAKGDESETDENVGLCAAAAVLWARRFVGS
jgi:predicted alpha/beta-hydrolase family hydrolase